MMKANNMIIERIIENALAEDMPFGDITTDSIFTGKEKSEAVMVAKEAGVVAGLWVAAMVFRKIDEEVIFLEKVEEGEKVESGTIIANISGRSASLLKGERVALNLLQRMCGIATITRRFADKLSSTETVIADTRKTTPGLRILEKYAVRTGGGTNHRFSLSDAVMIKDNHIKAAGGIREAVLKVRKSIPHTASVEVETTNLDEVKEALEAGADIIMLDNMDRDTIAKAVEIIGKKAVTEVSGNVTEDNVLEKAIKGIDIISSGSLTHSVRSMDISMRFV
ncbi:MAG TPA: carboxylating nicotinate-nucleotide diphosphorylase [Clostridia bacterium]|nr:carboxylating nicotinate-nucleotide diphosphorylase [Clostridia bacterium]